MREIVLDTETTGFDPAAGHRIVEIGCVELEDWLPTGRSFHAYLNPERDMPEDAERIHGLSAAFLADKPIFSAIAQEFIDFIADAPLVIHNAGFDMAFLNAELERAGHAPLSLERAIDTVRMARQKFPGQKASLDELCKRFGIDLSLRTKHGALLDAELLAQVYLELRGGRQAGLTLAEAREDSVPLPSMAGIRPPRPHAPTPEELAAHAAFIAKIKDAIWLGAEERETAVG